MKTLEDRQLGKLVFTILSVMCQALRWKKVAEQTSNLERIAKS